MPFNCSQIFIFPDKSSIAMTQGDNIEEDESKIDRFQPKTLAMKSWKKKYLAGDKSKNKPIAVSTPIENIGVLEQLRTDDGWEAGFFRPLKLFLPLSIISFFNESINGVFCIWGPCSSPPSYYLLPKLIAFISIFPFLMLVLQERGESAKHGEGYGKGVFWGVVVGFLMFILLSVWGLFGEW
tara:strand:+ start:115 stop:660 length:546 start_codon:yes stop_codon:yes gene_type:complete